MSGKKALGWAVVGTGAVSRNFASDLSLETRSLRIAVASRSSGKARTFARDFGFLHAYEGLDGLLADPAVDIVYIATPHGTHLQVASLALRAGKHVLIEKPIGRNGGEAREVHELALQCGLFAMEGMWMKFNPAFRRVMMEIQSGVIGEVRSLQASFGRPFPKDGSSRWSAKMGGSTLLDQGIYPVTLATALFGQPSEIVARGSLRDDGVDLAEHMTLEFSGGRYAQLAASMVDFAAPSAVINGTKGWITIPVPFYASSEFRVHVGPDKNSVRYGTQVEAQIQGNGFIPMIRHVNETISAGHLESDVHTISDTLVVHDVLDVIRTQLRQPENVGSNWPSRSLRSDTMPLKLPAPS